MSAIPKGSRVLVTGANGFLASQIVNQLLLSGFAVRGTVRDASKGKWLSDYFGPSFGDKFELAIVPDMGADGAYDSAVKGTAGVVHVASNMSFAPDPNAVIPETISATLNAIKAAAKESSVKRFVLTSSAAAVAWPDSSKAVDIDENTWNTGAIERSWAPPPYDGGRAWDVYAASKAESEKAMWEFARENKLSLDLNAIIPNTIFGPILSPGKQERTSTAGFVAGIFDNGLAGIEGIPPQRHIDVRDCAKLHIAALVDPDVVNQRIFAYANPWDWNRVLKVLRKTHPSHEFPSDLSGLVDDKSRILKMKDAEDILKRNFGGRGFIPLDETIKANVAHITV